MNRFTLLSGLIFVSLLGRIDTALGQSNLLQVSQLPAVFNSVVGGSVQTQVVNVTSSGAPLAYNVAVNSTQNWLSVDSNSGTTPGKFTLSVGPGNLPVGLYGGTITITAAGANPVVLNTSLSVGGASTLLPSTNNLTFSAQVGSTATTPQTLSISSANNAIQFTTSVSYLPAGGPNWLQISPVSSTTPAPLQVTASAAGLAAGTYSATINITSTQSNPIQVFVTFTVTPQPVLTSSQSAIGFFYQIGQASPAQTTLTISSGTGNIPLNIATSTSSCGSWLVVTPQGQLSSPANLSVGASVVGLNANATCTGAITVTGQGATNSPLTIPVTLTVSTNPLLLITPSTPTPFMYQQGGAFPASQNLTLSSSSTPLQFTASSDQPWLTVTPSGTTSPTATLTLTISPPALALLNPGTYTAKATIIASAASNSPVVVPVTLTVSSSNLFTVSPPFINFNYQIGQQAPTAQGILIGSTGAPLPFSISVPSTASTQFVTINGAASATGTTGATVQVGVSPLPNVAGVYQNTLVIANPNSASTTPQNVPISLTVSNTALLNSSPQALNFTVPIGQTTLPATQIIAFSSTDPTTPLTFTVTTGNTAPWLILVFADGTQKATTPANLNVSLAPYIYAASSTPGVYTGTIMVTAAGPTGQPQTINIPVTLTVTSGLSLAANPTSLSFTQVATAAAPVNQTITLSVTGPNSGTLPFSAVAATDNGGPWLSVSPATGGTSPGVVTVSITPLAASLSPGTYTGQVVFNSVTSANPSGKLVIPITLTVTAAPTLSASPLGVTLTGSVGGANPSSQLTISSLNSTAAVAFAVTTSGGAWLSVTPLSGNTPATLTASANLTGLAAGTYNASIIITPTGGSSPLTVPVTLSVTAQPVPVFTQLINAASGASGAVAPGEIISLFGTGIGPASPAGLTITPAGTVATTLAGVTVTFNGIAAPLTYVSASQINCVVPYEVIGNASVQLQVSYNGVVSTATAINVAATLPGIFTQNASGSGPAAVQKADYSLVTNANPAVRGSTIIIYATGEGQTSPAGATGTIAGNTLKNPTAPVSVLIGGQTATVVYAGSSPGLVSGVLQLNVIVPTTIAAGNQPVVVSVGGAPSQSNVTIALQ